MTGKVFAESANIYQDQAKILFDYYKKAAEKIVREEMYLEEKRYYRRNHIGRYCACSRAFWVGSRNSLSSSRCSRLSHRSCSLFEKNADR